MATENENTEGTPTEGTPTEGTPTDETKTPEEGVKDTGEEGKAADEASESTDDKSGDESSSDDKSGGDKNAGGDQSSPESYSDFTMPEGVKIDETALAEATPLFKELNLSQENAQKLIDLQAKMVQEGVRKQADTFSQLIEGWKTEAKTDKEIGGENYSENVAIAAKAVDTYGDKDFKQLMEDHGLQHNPSIIRFMHRVGLTLKEDVPDTYQSPNSPQQDRISILYPNDKKE